MKSVPLRRRILLLVAAGIVPVAVMSAVALVALFVQQRQQAERAALEIARALATAVDAELRRSTAVLEVLSTDSTLDMGDIPGFSERALRTLGTQPYWGRVLLARPDATPLLNTGVEQGRAIPPVVEPQSFRQAVQTMKPVIGNIARGQRGEFMVPIRMPVVRNGELKYVLTAVITPNAILDIVRRQRVPNDWTVSVFDSRNMRVARNRSNDEYLGTAAAPSLAEIMDGKAEGTGYTRVLEGDMAFSAFVRVRDTGWTVAMSVPPQFVLSGARNSLIAYG
ncbi:MAG: cache domain-containing protein, partial [Bacillota bacterium]